MERVTSNPSTTPPLFIKGKTRLFHRAGDNQKASGSAGGWMSAFCLLSSVFCLALSISSAIASPQPWHSLTPSQQEALAPLSRSEEHTSELQSQSNLVF